jgi:hypothetical protein
MTVGVEMLMIHVIDDLFCNNHPEFGYIYCLVIEIMGFVWGKSLCTMCYGLSMSDSRKPNWDQQNLYVRREYALYPLCVRREYTVPVSLVGILGTAFGGNTAVLPSSRRGCPALQLLPTPHLYAAILRIPLLHHFPRPFPLSTYIVLRETY